MKGFVTFSHICVEIDLIQGIPNRILIDWDENDPYMQMIDYENTTFKCLSCQQTGHLQETCPLSPTPASSHGVRKRANGWNEPKNRKIWSNSSFDNTQHHKDAPTPPPSTTPSQSPTNEQHPTAYSKHQPLASTQHLEALEILTLKPAVQPLQTPPEKGWIKWDDHGHNPALRGLETSSWIG